jgi:transposase
VDHLSGSSLAKERLKVVLETLAGTCRIGEACERLRISEPRFYQLRDRMLKAGLERMEPRQAGRPARQLSPAEEEVQALKEQLADLEVELRAAQARAEIALALPNVVQMPEDPEASQKKTRRRPTKLVPNRPPRPPGKKKST